jgi:hypothetical protein
MMTGTKENIKIALKEYSLTDADREPVNSRDCDSGVKPIELEAIETPPRPRLRAVDQHT